jgi:hypothetical protein
MRKLRVRHPDVGGIVHLEHVNFTIADYDLAAVFFMAGLGFTRDPFTRTDETNMAINVGLQQFHLPRRPAGTPPMHGVIGLISPELEAVRQRFDGLAREGIFDGTPYRYTVMQDFHEIMSPFGVRMRLHPTGSLPYPRVLGLPYVEIPVPAGSAAGISRFYQRVMQAPVAHEESGNAVQVTMGPYQWVRFVETDGLNDYDNGTFHIAYYVGHYGAVFDAIDNRGDLMGGGDDQVFFFKNIFDPDTGKTVFALQNEIRSFYHADFMRPLVNRWPMSDEPISFQRDQERERKRYLGVMQGI